MTVNRLCASGLSRGRRCLSRRSRGRRRPLRRGRRRVDERARRSSREADELTATATTSTTRSSAGASRTRGCEEMFPLESMGETGENVAERWDVSREDQDAFALRSQRRWAAAAEAGRFDDELVAGRRASTRDEHPRPDTSAREARGAEAGLPRGRDGHGRQLRAGINDGAAALVIASRGAGARARGRAARPRSSASAVAGVDPRVMGIGPVPAVRKLLERVRASTSASSTSSS